MKLGAGEHLLRLTLLTPAHLGSGLGEASLDRPTQKDAVSGLPCLPDSSLKGVLASPFGDSQEEGENPEREGLFGSPDRAERRGRPGPLVLGDGELLAFPVPSRDGSVAWVFPAPIAGRFLRLLPRTPDTDALLDLVGILTEERGSQVLAWPRLPDLPSAPGLRRLALRPPAPALLGQLTAWAGPGVPAEAPRLVVGAAVARRLWPAAAERRVATGLTPGKTVRPGALRAVELIPAGSVFLSWATCLGGAVPELPSLFQLGAWEGLGCGWVDLGRVGSEREDAPPAAGRPPAAGSEPEEAQILVETHRAIAALREGAPELAKAVGSAISDFASRVLRSGLEAALAFELAKAKPYRAQPSAAERAHRWLLSALLTPSPAPPAREGVSAALQRWLAEAPFPESVAGSRGRILTRWLWLRRHAELGLETSLPSSSEEAAAHG
jgi:CRISPR/Cas system CMR subunit Cmr4 (Cas7 group RAMP superfamily)